eukprot:gb/GECH01003691.1/.p1 GENE.gb/GECH01003691.1/~~gb/GECH01003691.1/.p1  ORF type:complete len:239 (+),score=57.63 gb/GECH01003691.1/:1-717(+)
MRSMKNMTSISFLSLTILFLLSLLNILSFFVAFTAAEPSQVENCDDPCGGTDDSQCRRGKNIVLQTQIIQDSKSRYSSFCVNVDEFSRLVIPNSYDDFLSQGDQTSIKVIGPNKETNERSFKDGDYVASFYSVTLELNGGSLENIWWNDSCDDDERCILNGEEKCVDKKDCGVETSSDINKDVKIFVAFNGTDSSGVYCRSSGSLPFKYRTFGWSNYYDEMVKIANDTKNSVTSVFNF